MRELLWYFQYKTTGNFYKYLSLLIGIQIVVRPWRDDIVPLLRWIGDTILTIVSHLSKSKAHIDIY